MLKFMSEHPLDSRVWVWVFKQVRINLGSPGIPKRERNLVLTNRHGIIALRLRKFLTWNNHYTGEFCRRVIGRYKALNACLLVISGLITVRTDNGRSWGLRGHGSLGHRQDVLHTKREQWPKDFRVVLVMRYCGAGERKHGQKATQWVCPPRARYPSIGDTIDTADRASALFSVSG